MQSGSAISLSRSFRPRSSASTRAAVNRRCRLCSRQMQLTKSEGRGDSQIHATGNMQEEAEAACRGSCIHALAAPSATLETRRGGAGMRSPLMCSLTLSGQDVRMVHSLHREALSLSLRSWDKQRLAPIAFHYHQTDRPHTRGIHIINYCGMLLHEPSIATTIPFLSSHHHDLLREIAASARNEFELG